ncbi:MAG: HAD family phosphatase [Erysipelotrichaceae bacterium]|nr:HAD family phosphatase [Erysipelotrichaceae bacterium]
MKRYQNIIFDFGNVIGRFDTDALLKTCTRQSDEHLKQVIFHNWACLDDGIISYDSYIEECLAMADPCEHASILEFFQTWYHSLEMIEEVNEWIPLLKKQGYRIYLLSNAPIIFEEHIDEYPIMQYFDGQVLSASIQMTKPHPEIYEYLLKKYQLDASQCFFLDDREENIQGAKASGIDGMVYHQNLDEIKRKIYEI